MEEILALDPKEDEQIPLSSVDAEAAQAGTALEGLRDEKGRFVQGKSGNPEGRPKGSKNRVTVIRQAIEERLVDQLDEVASQVLAIALQKALEGDRDMIKLVLNKVLPAVRAEETGAGKGVTNLGLTIITSDSQEKGVTINADPIKDEEQ